MTQVKKIIITVWLLMLFIIGNQIFSKQYDVLGIGAPCVDLIMPVSDAFLMEHDIPKAASIDVPWDRFHRLLTEGNIQEENIVTGGCTSNTLKGLAKLGRACAFFGKVGHDAVAEKILDTMASHQITTKFLPATLPSQQVLCLPTPDHERSFCVFHGAATELSEKDLFPELFENTTIVHIEGYQLPNSKLVENAIKMAKAAGIQVSLDLGTYLLVDENRDRLLAMLPDIDILFANRDEAKSLTGKEPEEACDMLRNMCGIAVICTGHQGCWVGNSQEKVNCPAFQVEVIDTTGAGDLFASGFLHAHLSGQSLFECGRFGNLLGSTIIQNYGAEIPDEKWSAIHSSL